MGIAIAIDPELADVEGGGHLTRSAVVKDEEVQLEVVLEESDSDKI